MGVFDRLEDHPEVLLPLWGLPTGHRAGDRHARIKGRFWDSLTGRRDRWLQAASARVAAAPNVARADAMTASSRNTSAIAEREVGAALAARLWGLRKRPGKILKQIREIDPPADIEAKMEECTPQFTLRPLPRVEREPPEELPIERHPSVREVSHADVEAARADALRSVRARPIALQNMAVMRAHRRFHNRVLHETAWPEHLSREVVTEQQGPMWAWTTWEGWEPLLDPIPHEERPALSGFLDDRDSPVRLE